MSYFFIEPEVAGGLGHHTILDSSTHPPKIEKLHYTFDGWLGDVLLESFPCYIVTKSVGNKMLQADLTGFSFDKVETSASDEFAEFYPARVLPEFFWLKVTGKAEFDDFGVAEDLRLVISSRALELFQANGLENALIDPTIK